MRETMRGLMVAALASGAAWGASAHASAEAIQGPCDTPTAHALDFWVGKWRVANAEGALQGENAISVELDGCALVERWAGAGGGFGMSLFVYDARADAWSQTWVTNDTSRPWGHKEKAQVEAPEGSVRFQGSYALDDGRAVVDRTTLTPLDDGRVRQLIELSVDGGEWQATFDGYYARPDAPPE